MRLTSTLSAALVSVVALLAGTQSAAAAACSNTSAGFEEWAAAFKQQAEGQGFSPRMLDKVFSSVSYSRSTISADRGQKSFKLSFDQFMQKRGGQTIINRGKTMKKNNAALFSRLEQRYGVPAGPLIAIWGMETAFGTYMGKQNTISAVATLAYDCRRSDFFRPHLIGALKMVDKGMISPNTVGAKHGELGHTQFLPGNALNYGVDGNGDGRRDLFDSFDDVFASVANYFRKKGGERGGWVPGGAVVARAELQPGFEEFNPETWTPDYTLADLADIELLTFQRGSLPHVALLDLFRSHRVEPRRVHTISSVSAMLQMAQGGFGVATLPREAVQHLLAVADLRELPQAEVVQHDAAWRQRLSAWLAFGERVVQVVAVEVVV